MRRLNGAKGFTDLTHGSYCLTVQCENCKLSVFNIFRLSVQSQDNRNVFTIIFTNFIHLLLRYYGLCSISTTPTPLLDSRTRYHHHVLDIVHRKKLSAAFHIRRQCHFPGSCYRSVQTAQDYPLLQGHLIDIPQDSLKGHILYQRMLVKFNAERYHIGGTLPLDSVIRSVIDLIPARHSRLASRYCEHWPAGYDD